MERLMGMDMYQRDKSLLPRTLAFYQFKRDFTTVNDYYWGWDHLYPGCRWASSPYEVDR